MDHPIDMPQWNVRAAYRKGWEVRLAYYERLLRSVMEMLEAVQSIVKADDLSWGHASISDMNGCANSKCWR